MSAVVARLERDEVFWFRKWVGNPRLGTFHAFELVQGDFEPLSICGKAHIDDCDDVPAESAGERQGVSCTFCLSGVL